LVPQLQNTAIRYTLFAMWLLIVGGALYLYFFEREFVETQLQGALSTSMVVASIVYVILGSFRAFTLVPATFLLVVALPFFPPLWLLIVTMAGVIVSSSICYFFAEALHMDEFFEKNHPAHIRRLKGLLQRYQVPIIIGWSFLMFLPTDLICYVCGTLRINFTKFIVCLLIGEGSVYAIYIYAADYFLRG
jgi:uncharacterized membrane protein YdjX (TVP38/TMEM64 family)